MTVFLPARGTGTPTILEARTTSGVVYLEPRQINEPALWDDTQIWDDTEIWEEFPP
jgi:hypothetical protein